MAYTLEDAKQEIKEEGIAPKVVHGIESALARSGGFCTCWASDPYLMAACEAFGLKRDYNHKAASYGEAAWVQA